MIERISGERVAEILGVSRRTVQALTARGDLPAAKVGRKWTYSEAKIRQWLAEQEERQQQRRAAPLARGVSPEVSRPMTTAGIAKAYEQARQKLLRGASRK